MKRKRSLHFASGLIAGGAVLFLASCGGDKTPDIQWDHPTIYNADALEAAMAQARETLPVFFEALASPAPGTEGYEVFVRKPSSAAKYRFDYVWVGDIAPAADRYTGHITSDAGKIASDARDKDALTFSRDEIFDWKFRDADGYFGAFTMRAKLDLAPGSGNLDALKSLYHDPATPDQTPG